MALGLLFGAPAAVAVPADFIPTAAIAIAAIAANLAGLGRGVAVRGLPHRGEDPLGG